MDSCCLETHRFPHAVLFTGSDVSTCEHPLSPGSGEGQSDAKGNPVLVWERERDPIKASSCRTLGSRPKRALEANGSERSKRARSLRLSLDDGLPAPLH
jgi:hypothetical protein